MPLLQTTREVLERAQEIRLRTLEHVDQELTRHHLLREEQIKLSQEERSKLNLLIFAVIGAVLGLSPALLGDALVDIGLATLLLNAFVFGYLADYIQRNNNIKNFETGINELQNAVRPYFDAYESMLLYYDDHSHEETETFRAGFQSAFDSVQEKYIEYLQWQKNRKPRYAPKTVLAVGHWYFALFAISLFTVGLGLFLHYRP